MSLSKTYNPYLLMNSEYGEFKAKHSFENRSIESSKIISKYPDRIPVIVEKQETTDIVEIDKNKYLVPRDLTVGQFVYVIRKRMKLPPEKAIFIFVNNQIPMQSMTISTVYNENKDDDGFLYIKYAGENTFGK